MKIKCPKCAYKLQKLAIRNSYDPTWRSYVMCGKCGHIRLIKDK